MARRRGSGEHTGSAFPWLCFYGELRRDTAGLTHSLPCFALHRMQVMCRKSLGLCMPEQTPQTHPAEHQRRASECSSEAADVASSMNRLVADTQETVRQARSLTAGEFKDPHSLRVAMNAFQ